MFEEIINILRNNEYCVLVTVVDKEEHGPGIIGSKLLISSNGDMKGTVGGGQIEFLAINECMEVFLKKRSYSKKYILNQQQNTENTENTENTGMICGGTTTLFFEYISNGISVYIFGAGHVGKALINHMKYLNYDITLFDHRIDMLNEIKGIKKCVLVDYTNVFEEKIMLDGGYIIIATPSHMFDYTVLKSIFESGNRPKYIGMLGSKKKATTLFKKIKEDFGETFDSSCLYIPAGLDIGGGTPDEIAISIIAEMQYLIYKKEGNIERSSMRNLKSDV